MTTKKWDELEPRQRRAIVVAGTLQTGLALAAWYDLSHRPQDQVNGPKLLWALVIAVNFIGPLAYFRFGRHQPVIRKASPWHEKLHLDTTAFTRACRG